MGDPKARIFPLTLGLSSKASCSPAENQMENTKQSAHACNVIIVTFARMRRRV